MKRHFEVSSMKDLVLIKHIINYMDIKKLKGNLLHGETRQDLKFCHMNHKELLR